MTNTPSSSILLTRFVEIEQTKLYSTIQHRRGSFERDGYLKFEGFLSQQEIFELLAFLEQIKKEKQKNDIINPPAFRALSESKVLEALRKSCFGAELFGATGNIDTIGHGLHYIPGSPFEKLIRENYKLKVLIQQFTDLRVPLAVQTKAILKPAKTGSRVPPHTDEQYIFTKPTSGLALWIALDDSKVSNGCVEVVPGSHNIFEQGQRFSVPLNESKALWITPDDTGGANKKPFPYLKKDIEDLNWFPVEVRSGDCLIMDVRLLHASSPNTSKFSRKAFTIHVVDGLCEWDPANWIIPHPDLGFEKCKI